MRIFTQGLAVPGAVGVGAAQLVRDFQSMAVQVIGAFTGSLTIEISLNGGADYAAASAAITAPGLFNIPWPATHIRVRVVSLTGAPPAVAFAGFDTNG